MCLDGENPQSPVILDSAGNLYGTVYGGGDYGRGAVFELKRVANGKWTETILYSFCPSGICEDGAEPETGLVFDSAGNLLC